MSDAGFDPAFVHALRNQSWPLYAVGMTFISLRIQIRKRGFRNLWLDDYGMLMAAGWYTVLIVCLNVIATGGGSNLFLPDQFATFSEVDIKERIKGSKIVLVSEQGMLNVIWTLKGCMLFFYYRLTGRQLSRQRAVKALAVYVALGWIAVEITFFTACRPFRGYWGMPPPDPQCTTLQHYAMVQACFNISSDLLMLLVPLPIVISTSLPTKQKIALSIVFSMGIFVIIAAILTKVYNLSNVYDTSYMLWYTREASVAVYVANLPMLWPLFREWFPCLRNLSAPRPSALPVYGSNSRSAKNNTNDQGDQSVHLGYIKSTSQSTGEPITPVESRRPQSERTFDHFTSNRTDSLESDERVLNEGNFWGGTGNEVHIKNDIVVETISIDPETARTEKSLRFEWGQDVLGGPQVKIEGPKLLAEGPPNKPPKV
ncbi:hypothetical protein K432DRAFT_290209 [Lepidopterella palustris CBS 459.81]|uniref:Rhodopsin domain-containing protein n=1 Tax=Lepidopterella palustris CBS 459.81 TaxID=1314670 RepID=A0A8E2EH43_9PEZI|nr:hypothetical protein K432DRAFT_290209 [Lepidopterella palustris CBS 459.81]